MRFPKIRGTILGVQLIMISVFGGLGSPYFGELPSIYSAKVTGSTAKGLAIKIPAFPQGVSFGVMLDWGRVEPRSYTRNPKCRV